MKKIWLFALLALLVVGVYITHATVGIRLFSTEPEVFSEQEFFMTGGRWQHLENVNCTTFTDEPYSLNGWEEDYDFGNRTFYCMFNQSIFYVAHPMAHDGGNNWTIGNPADLWYNNFNITEQGNVRQVEVEIDYYEPSYRGTCLSHTTFKDRDEYGIKMSLLVANDNQGFDEDSTFDDAFYVLNDYIVDNNLLCDQWNTIQLKVGDFTNDFGSSFSGQSKNIGTIGLEAHNMFIGRIEIIGSEQSVRVW